MNNINHFSKNIETFDSHFEWYEACHFKIGNSSKFDTLTINIGNKSGSKNLPLLVENSFNYLLRSIFFTAIFFDETHMCPDHDKISPDVGHVNGQLRACCKWLVTNSSFAGTVCFDICQRALSFSPIYFLLLRDSASRNPQFGS